MANIGNPFTPVEKKAVLCGSGELGKEIAIELERYGVNVVAVDKYANAPAMQWRNRLMFCQCLTVTLSPR